jgi:predicted PhzF superfamily epimerase YddE/YHI9
LTSPDSPVPPPASEVDEDPVTGVAHCCLGEFWRKRLGKSAVRAYQGSARGGVVKVHVLNFTARVEPRHQPLRDGAA